MGTLESGCLFLLCYMITCRVEEMARCLNVRLCVCGSHVEKKGMTDPLCWIPTLKSAIRELKGKLFIAMIRCAYC